MDNINVYVQLHAIFSKQIWQVKKKEIELLFFFLGRGNSLSIKKISEKNNKKFIFPLSFLTPLSITCLELNTQ